MSRHRADRPQRRDGAEREAGEQRARAAAIRQAAADESAALRSFEAALRLAPDEGAGAGDVEVLSRLRSETIAGMGRVVYSSNAVFLVELDGPDPTHPDQPLRAIYKPARGERPLWDFPRHTLHLREVAAYLVSAALGDGLVPPTTLRDGPHGPGSVQMFIHSTVEPVAGAAEPLELQLQGLAALDVVLNNADRKRAHLLFGDDGRLRGIDNALSFLSYPHQRTVLLELGGQRMPEAVAGRLTRLAADQGRRDRLCAHLGALLDRDEVGAFADRLDVTSRDPRYPVLDPWEGRPFEWW
ncbi:MAG: hypothetical protein M3Y09_19455 [Actinomycetota bacterium]|nr:hypothetical protein [Actinomycetota bacterium]